MKTCTHTRILIVALFIITRKWKQPKYPSVDEWINKSPHNGILCSNEKDLITDICNNMDESSKHNAKSVTKEHMLYVFHLLHRKCVEQTKV